MTQNSLRDVWGAVRSCEELNNHFKSKIWGRLERTVKMDQFPPLEKEKKKQKKQEFEFLLLPRFLLLIFRNHYFFLT